MRVRFYVTSLPLFLPSLRPLGRLGSYLDATAKLCGGTTSLSPPLLTRSVSSLSLSLTHTHYAHIHYAHTTHFYIPISISHFPRHLSSSPRYLSLLPSFLSLLPLSHTHTHIHTHTHTHKSKQPVALEGTPSQS